MTKNLLILLFVSSSLFVFAQEEQKNYGIKFSGFVKNDFWYNTRQVESAREGHFYLYPSNVNLDVEDKDINAQPNFGILSIQSRLTGAISGPDAFGAKTSGVIEADFFGNAGDENGFRLRHSFGKLNWEKSELLFGQYWHPMFATACFPDVVNFNTGVPFQPFSRNPQIRYTYKLGSIKLMVAALAQRDFASKGGSATLRNSASPDMQLQISYSAKNDSAGTSIDFGVIAGYKTIKPRLQTSAGYKADEVVSGTNAQVFCKIKTKPLTYKISGVYGQNISDVMMLGGYAVRDTAEYSSDYLTYDDRQYTTLNTISSWLDIHTNGKAWQVGLFGGFTKNLGSNQNILDWNNTAYYFTTGQLIAYVYRVSPRVIWNSGKTRISLELDYTTAAYGKSNDSLGKVLDAEEVSNVRLLWAMYYFF